MKKFKIMVNIKVSSKIYLAFTIIINNLEKIVNTIDHSTNNNNYIDHYFE